MVRNQAPSRRLVLAARLLVGAVLLVLKAIAVVAHAGYRLTAVVCKVALVWSLFVVLTAGRH